jgi:hypothetical protein
MVGGPGRLHLDHVVASSPPEGLMDPDQFRTHLTEESIAFVEYAGDRREATSAWSRPAIS